MTNLKKSLILIATLGSISSLYSSTINPNGTITDGARTMPRPKMIGGQGGIYHGNTTPTFPIFNSLELTGAQGESGAFYPILRVAFLQDKAGNTTYFTNVTPKAPASDVAHVYTQNFATTSINGKAIALHAVAMTPEVTTKIKAHYNMLIGSIPSIAANASTIQNKTIGELWEIGLQMINSWLPKPVYVA